MEVTGVEKFSLAKFFAGFANIGKILFILVLFTAFTIVKDKFAPVVNKQANIQTVGTYIEAPDNKIVRFFGIKIMRVGLGVIYE